MIPGATAISESAIDALPDSSYNYAEVSMSAKVEFDGVAFSPYQAFVTDQTRRKVYSVEITARTLRGA